MTADPVVKAQEFASYAAALHNIAENYRLQALDLRNDPNLGPYANAARIYLDNALHKIELTFASFSDAADQVATACAMDAMAVSA